MQGSKTNLEEIKAFCVIINLYVHKTCKGRLNRDALNPIFSENSILDNGG